MSQADSTSQREEVKTRGEAIGAGADSAPPHQVTNITTQQNIDTQNVQNVQNNIQNNMFILIGSEAKNAPIGWPKGWPLPPADVRPFLPPNFAVPPRVLSRATASSTDIEGCKRGDPKAVAELMTEIVKQVHSNPAERNIYLNPKRADQVLVFAHPSRWNVLSLQEGTTLAFARVADEIAESMQFTEEGVQDVARGAQAGFQARRGEVVKSSRTLMAAHLENVAARLGESERECWLGNLDGVEKLEAPRIFGQERHGHIDGQRVVMMLELNLNVSRAEDITAENVSDLARQSLQGLAQLLLHRRPENLTILCSEGAVYVHTPWGWKPKPATVVATEQALTLAELLGLYLTSQKAAHFAPLATYLAENTAALGQEAAKSLSTLMYYARAAAKYYAATEGPALAVPRQLVLADAHAKRITHTTAMATAMEMAMATEPRAN